MEYGELTQLGSGKQLRTGRDALEMIRGEGAGLVIFKGKELQAVCPITQQPDVYEWEIEIEPRGRYVESKSLKAYLGSWRDVGITCEQLAQEIADDVQAASDAWRVTVRLTQNVRGGMSIFAAAHKHRKAVEGDPAKDKGAWIFLKDNEFRGGQDNDED